MSDKKITVTTTPKNRIVVNKGGSYSGIDTLVELRDVDAVNKKDNDVLVFEAANNKFVIKEVPFVNSSFQTANAAFDKANAANVLAYTVGINANAWANTKVSSVLGTSGQIYSSGGTTPTLNLISTGVTARTYGAANQIPVITVDAFGRLTSAANVAVEGMNYVYANSIGASSNAWANTIGTAGNAYTVSVGAASNAWTNTVGTAGNNYSIAIGVAGNNYSIAVGASSNAWTNSINVYSDATYFRRSGGTISGSVTVVGNLGITGNLAVTGNTYFISTENYRVSDPLIYLAGNNYISDIVDIGFIANYVNTTGANVHTGLYREHENKEWYLFQGYDKEPENNHIGAFSNNMTLAVLNSDLRTSNLTLGGTNAISWITSAFSKANNALANTSDVSFNGNLYFPTGSISIGNVAPSGALHISKALTRAILLNRPEIGTTVTDGAYIGIGGTVADGFGFINQETGPIKFGTSDTERMRITGTGDVGIGTSTPTAKLEIFMTGGAAAIRLGNENYVEWKNAAGSAYPVGIYGSSTNAFRVYTNSVDRLEVTSGGNFAFNTNQLYVKQDVGNIGIGLTTPSARLHISKAGTGDEFIIGDLATNYVKVGGIGSGTSYIRSFEGSFDINNPFVNGVLLFSTAGSERLRINSLGNVGIGTTSPSSKLQVNGTITIANTGPVESFRSGANNITLNMYNEANGTLSWEGSAGQLFSITNDLTGSIFSVNDVSGIPSIDVNANGNISLAQFSGNVGIGTSNPVYKLDVNGDARITGNLTLGDATTDTITVNAANFNLANNVSFDSGTLFIDKNNDRIGVGTTSPAYKLDVNGDARLGPLGGSGNLYFPTTINNFTPSVFSTYNNNRLTVYVQDAARLVLNGDGAVDLDGATVITGKNSNVPLIVNQQAAAWTANLFEIRKENVQQLVVDVNGRVGIGTSSPTVKLHVAGDAIFTGNVTVSGNTTYMNTQTLLIGDNLITLNADLPNNLPATEDAGIEVNRGAYGNASIIWNETNDRWDVRANNNTYVTITESGRVGIGTSTPQQKLDVNGKVRIRNDGTTDNDTQLFGAVGDGSTESWSLKMINVGSGFGRGISLNTRDARDPILLHANSANPSSALVGIGLSTLPTSTLDVNGTVNALAYKLQGTQALYVTSAGSGYNISPTLGTQDSRDYILLQPSGGSVGIGTSSPAAKLDVAGSFKFANNNVTFSENGVETTNDVGSLTWNNNAGFKVKSSSTTDSAHLVFQNANTSGRIYLTNATGPATMVFRVAEYETFYLRKGDNRPGSAIFGGLSSDQTYNDASLLSRGRWDGAPAAIFAKRTSSTFTDIIKVTDETLTTTYFNVSNTGNVGIGTTTPTSTLHVVGTANITSGIVTTGNITTTGTMTAQHFDNVSDITLKENIEPIQDALNTLEKLNPVSFTWKKDGSTSFGLIAQEVEKILPEIVHQSDEVKTVSYTQIISLLIAAIKELNTKLDDLT